MCGRFALAGDSLEIKQRFGLREELKFTPHYNVAPGMMMPVILFQDAPVAVLAKWGLIPFWATDPKIGYKMINARCETVSEKSAFRKAFQTQRCLVPASGFFEWLRVDGKKSADKIPYYIKLRSQPIFSFAGLYDIWKDIEGRQLLTFTILTTEPNEIMKPIHNRMPVIIGRQNENNWLNDNPENIKSLFIPYDDKEMEAYPVSKSVNNPENDSEEIIKAITSNQEIQLPF